MNAAKKTRSEDELLVFVQARPDPRNEVTKKRKPKTLKLASRENDPPTREIFAKLVFITRVYILDCSMNVFANLIREDEIRKRILAGVSANEAEKHSGGTSLGTIDRIEKGAGDEGVKLDVYPLLANRIVHPLLPADPNGNPFMTPLELQALATGFGLEEYFTEEEIEDMKQIVDSTLEGDRSYIEYASEVHQKRDIDLGYIDTAIFQHLKHKK